MGEDKKGPAVKFPPPLVYVLWMVFGGILQKFYPTDIGIPFDHQYWGLGMVILGVCFLIYVSSVFKKAETNIKPWEPTNNIITTGIYRKSRNPIYLGFNIFPIGLGIFFDNLWVLLSFLPATLSLYHFAIKKKKIISKKNLGMIAGPIHQK